MTTSTTLNQQPDPSTMTPLVRRSEAFFRALLWLLVAYSFVVWGVALVDWFRHPLALSPHNAFGGNPAFRAFSLFVGAPVVAMLTGLVRVVDETLQPEHVSIGLCKP